MTCSGIFTFEALEEAFLAVKQFKSNNHKHYNVTWNSSTLPRIIFAQPQNIIILFYFLTKGIKISYEDIMKNHIEKHTIIFLHFALFK